MRWVSPALLLGGYAGCYQPRTLSSAAGSDAGSDGGPVVDADAMMVTDAAPDAFVAPCFADPFSGTSVDGTRWSVFSSAGAKVSEGGGSLSLTVGPQASQFADVVSASHFKIATLAVQAVTAPTVAGFTTDMQFFDNLSNGIRFGVQDGQLFAQTVGSPGIDITNAFDPIADAWLRVVRDGTNVVFQTSPDGATWQMFTSLADPIGASTAGTVTLIATTGTSAVSIAEQADYSGLVATCLP